MGSGERRAHQYPSQCNPCMFRCNIHSILSCSIFLTISTYFGSTLHLNRWPSYFPSPSVSRIRARPLPMSRPKWSPCGYTPPLRGGGIFNRHFGDYCTGGDTPKPSRWLDSYPALRVFFIFFRPSLTPPAVAGILRLVLRGGFGRIGVVRAGRLNASKMGNSEGGGLLLSVAEGPAACARHWKSTSLLIPATTEFGIDKRTHSREPRRNRGESGYLKEDGNGKTKHTT
jgi:hypothetical protein